MLKQCVIGEIPKETLSVAEASFPKGNLYLRLREVFISLYSDEDFEDMFSKQGRPAIPAWRLALVTVFQFMENLTDRQAADAVRSRIDWKCALGLELRNSGFDFSVLCDFRKRLVTSDQGEILLDKFLDHLKTEGLIKPKGKQRSDSTHVLANIRTLNRCEMVGETMRAALNVLSTEVPDWLYTSIPEVWYERYVHRVEAYRIAKSKVGRETYLRTVAEDGYFLLDILEDAPKDVSAIKQIEILRQVLVRYFVREEEKILLLSEPATPVADAIVSPYDAEARYANKGSVSWNGYKVHITETCDDDKPNFIVGVRTTVASEHDIKSTAVIHATMAEKDLVPKQHFVDGAYTDAGLFASSEEIYDIQLIGPPPHNPAWQSKQEDAFSVDDFDIDWQTETVTCPAGKQSYYWNPYQPPRGGPRIQARFAFGDCQACQERSKCTRAKKFGRFINFQPQQEFEALKAARDFMLTAEGELAYNRRAGIEGTISQEVRAFGARHCRYIGHAKTHLQQVSTAVATNIVRYDAWLQAKPSTPRPPPRLQQIRLNA